MPLRFALIAAALFSRLAFSQCAPEPATQRILDAYAAAAPQGTDAEKKVARAGILQKALAAAPTDYFLLDRQRDLLDDNTSAGREASVAYFAALHQKYPDSPAVTAVYADVLRAKDSVQALSLLEASGKAHPDFPGTRLKLIPIFAYGKLPNQERLREEIDGFLKICPAVSNPYVYRVLLRSGSTEHIARTAPLLRARLEAESGPANERLWMVLWDLEFKAVAPTEHPSVRERIAKDLARLAESPRRNEVSWLSLRRNGYALVDDKAAIDRMNDQILKDHPDSGEAEQLVTDRWRKEHPFPAGNDKRAQQAWYRASAAAAHEWFERWHGPRWLAQEFSAVAALDDTSSDDLLKLAEKYVHAYHANPNSFYGALPVEFEVAENLIRKKALPAVIPEWIDRGYHRETNRPSRMLGYLRDEMSDEQKARADGQIDAMRIERARILLDYYDALGQRSKSRAVEDSLAGMNPADDRMKPGLFEARAKAAEMDNRKLDALVFYHAARALGGKPGSRGTTDAAALDEKIDRLWKDLGGTQAGLPLFTGKTQLAPVSAIRWETPRRPLPAFTLTDLAGKTWKLADLNGKATLINVWATWCVPCRAEHPEFQKLYERLKDRKEIALLSLNVDDEAGLVAPYMAEQHYTFPVILGKEVLEAVAGGGEVAIPQNWFVTPAARLRWTQLGYAGDPQWQSTMIARLEELLKAR